jgi:hypothetical protein
MRPRGSVVAAIAVALALPATAGATTTLGVVTAPANTTPAACPATSTDNFFVSAGGTGGSSSQYTVPGSSPLALTQWQVNATGATAGAQVELVVVNPQTSAMPASIDVVGTDTETLNPSAAAADGVETFSVANPIIVQPGDAISLYLPDATGITCYWSGGSLPTTDQAQAVELTSSPAVGDNILKLAGSSSSTPSAETNVAATLGPLSQDAALSLSASNATVGVPAVLTATVRNNGPLTGPITFTDPVPTGLTVDLAATNSGSCSTNAAISLVTCTLTGIPAGQSANAVILVTPKAAQAFTDSGTVAVASSVTDPNPANNSASTTFKVAAAGAPTKCVVPKLGGTPESVAQKVLPLLGCKVGKVRKATSKSVAKGDVISTAPGAGSYAVGKSVGITVSSGKPKPKPKKKKKK